MYKVFVNDRPIILTDSLNNDNIFSVYFFKEVVVDEIIHKLQTGNEQGILLICENLKKDWLKFQKSFKVLHAAGGLVFNKQQQVLFIYRGKKWDLPKGGIEKGESKKQAAIREVQEECGIDRLKIVKPLITTYHIFYQKAIQKLKVTHWFLMTTKFEGSLTPQLEEGITKVVFKSPLEIKKAMQKTYSNIQLVVEEYHKFM